MTNARLFAAWTLAAFAAACLTSCSPQQPPAGDPQNMLNNGNNVTDSTKYSLTQTIINSSQVDWTLLSAVPDNGGQMTPGYPTVLQAGATGVFAATNTGNGVQVKITFSGSGGQTLEVDSDVPKTSQNWTTDQVTGPGAGSLDVGPPVSNPPFLIIGSGKNPSASATVRACQHNCASRNFWPSIA